MITHLITIISEPTSVSLILRLLGVFAFFNIIANRNFGIGIWDYISASRRFNANKLDIIVDV